MEHQAKTCHHCGAPLAGRVDKRFCSDHCRSSAANTRKLTDPGERLMRDINMLLRHNRHLLRQASPHGKTTVRREVLELSGFNFSYFTHIYRTQKGDAYHFCYDYGYLLVPENKVLIVNWQQYMERRI